MKKIAIGDFQKWKLHERRKNSEKIIFLEKYAIKSTTGLETSPLAFSDDVEICGKSFFASTFFFRPQSSVNRLKIVFSVLIKEANTAVKFSVIHGMPRMEFTKNYHTVKVQRSILLCKKNSDYGQNSNKIYGHKNCLILAFFTNIMAGIFAGILSKLRGNKR
jgi:hypothetical protein